MEADRGRALSGTGPHCTLLQACEQFSAPLRPGQTRSKQPQCCCGTFRGGKSPPTRRMMCARHPGRRAPARHSAAATALPPTPPPPLTRAPPFPPTLCRPAFRTWRRLRRNTLCWSGAKQCCTTWMQQKPSSCRGGRFRAQPCGAARAPCIPAQARIAPPPARPGAPSTLRKPDKQLPASPACCAGTRRTGTGGPPAAPAAEWTICMQPRSRRASARSTIWILLAAGSTLAPRSRGWHR